MRSKFTNSKGLMLALASGIGAFAVSTQAWAIDPGTRLDIAKDGGDIVLTWDFEEGTEQTVWVSDTPIMTTGPLGNSTPLAVVEDGIFIDSGADDGTQRYYRVEDNGFPFFASQTAAVVPVPLYPGYTKLGVCLDMDHTDTVQLSEDMATGVLASWMWDPQAQSFVGSPWWQPQVPMSFVPGQVVAVEHNWLQPVTPGFYSMVGPVPAPSDMAIDMQPGDNLVTLPLTLGSMQASTLQSLVGSTQIRVWDAQSQSEHRYPQDGDIELLPCSPLHVEVDEPTVWLGWTAGNFDSQPPPGGEPDGGFLPPPPDGSEPPPPPPPGSVPPPPPGVGPGVGDSAEIPGSGVPTEPPPPGEVGAESADIEEEEDVEE